MSDDSTVMPGVTPSFAPEMRVEDLAAISGFTVTALNKRRFYGKPPTSTKQKKLVKAYSGRNQAVTYHVFDVDVVRAWLTDERPNQLPELDAWIAAHAPKVGV